MNNLTKFVYYMTNGLAMSNHIERKMSQNYVFM